MNDKARAREKRLIRNAVSSLVFWALVLAVVSSAHAESKFWTGAASSDWFNDSNWNPAGMPDADDDVILDVTGEATVVLANGTASIVSLQSEEPLQVRPYYSRIPMRVSSTLASIAPFSCHEAKIS